MGHPGPTLPVKTTMSQGEWYQNLKAPTWPYIPGRDFEVKRHILAVVYTIWGSYHQLYCPVYVLYAYTEFFALSTTLTCKECSTMCSKATGIKKRYANIKLREPGLGPQETVK